MRAWRTAWWLAVVVGVAISQASAAESLVGRSINDFSLQDFRGQQHALADWAGKPVVVVAFVGCECPLSKVYAPRLEQLSQEFAAQGVAFVGIDPNRQDSVTELAAYARTHGIEFPLLRDSGNVVADRFGAQRVPEVFVLDAERRVRYHGRIDDQYGIGAGSSGYAKPQLARRDLAEAITSVLAGKPVEVAETEATGCLIGRVRAPQADAAVTYSNQIARIMNNHCAECHRPGQIAPFALTNYEEAVGWADMIDEVVQQQRMPPWHADPRFGHFSNDIRLSDEQKAQIHAWVAAGAPEGDRKQLPEPPQFAEGWLMPEDPDQVIYMGDETFAVAPEGTVEYQYFEVDPGFTEDKWVATAECRPGNVAVVHHIIVFVRPPEGLNRENRDARGFGFLAGFAPGTRPFVYPEGMAKKIPAGSKLVFQMHYTPNGSAATDRSMIGLKFVKDPSRITHQVATTNAVNAMFEIPAGADNHAVKATRKIRRDSLVLSYFPHMHLRGKSMKYEAWYADGTKEVLLDVPHYDFNWQNHFILEQPKLMPKGSKIHVLAHFDNSENNLANPDPNSAVRWGDQTWEEMMIGWFDVAIPVEEASSVIRSAQDGNADREHPTEDDGADDSDDADDDESGSGGE